MVRKGLGAARRVVRREYEDSASGLGDGNIIHHLECGHTVTCKASRGIPDKKLCRECKG